MTDYALWGGAPWIRAFDTILDQFTFLVRSEKCLENASLIVWLM